MKLIFRNKITFKDIISNKIPIAPFFFVPSTNRLLYLVSHAGQNLRSLSLSSLVPLMSYHTSSTLHLNPTPFMDRRFQLHGTRVLFIARSFIRSFRVASRISLHDVVQIKAVAYKLGTTTSHTSGTDDNHHNLNLSETTRHDMGSEGCDARKPRFLCLHGFRTSGLILETQLGKWPESVRRNFDLVFLDGPFPAQGKSDVEGIFEPPYYEWFQFNKVRKT